MNSLRPSILSVNVDDAGGARQATELLLGLGHRRFAIITDRLSDPVSGSLISAPDPASIHFYVSRQRVQGYCAALEQSGINWSDVPFYECVDNNEADGELAMRTLLALSPRPTAVLCLTDRLALGAMAAAQQAGLQVPGDISIVGFDDIPRTSQVDPPLTTIRQDHREKGQQAAQMLLSLIHGESVPANLLLPVELVVRGSTSHPPQNP